VAPCGFEGNKVLCTSCAPHGCIHPGVATDLLFHAACRYSLVGAFKRDPWATPSC
jgi:hypothetical protein